MTDSSRTDELAHDEPDQLRDQLRQLFRHRAVIAAGLLVGLCGGVMLHQLGSSRYVSSGSLLVRDVTISPFDPGVAADKQINMQTEIQVASSLTVADLAAAALKEPDVTGDDLQKDLGVSVSPDSEVLGFSYSSPSPAEAAKRVNALMSAYLTQRETGADASLKKITSALKGQLKPLTTRYSLLGPGDPQRAQLSGQIGSLQSKLSDYQSVDTTPGRILAKGTAPTVPAGVGAPMSAALGGVVGLSLGILVAWLLSVLEPGVRDEGDVRRHLGAPVLATLPAPGRGLLPKRAPLLAVGSRNSRLGEAYRALALRVALTLDADAATGGRPVLLVVEPRETGHASEVAANLAAAFAETGEDVLLIESDMRHPQLAERLAGHLSGNGNDAKGRPLPPFQVNAGQPDGFFFVPGQRTRSVPKALAAIKSNADAHRVGRTIVVSAPAVLAYPDALAVAQWVDGVIVVCPGHGQRRSDLAQVRDFLGPSDTPVIGAVLRRSSGGRLGQLATRFLGGLRRRRGTSGAESRPAEAATWVAGPVTGPVAEAAITAPGRSFAAGFTAPGPDGQHALTPYRRRLEQGGE